MEDRLRIEIEMPQQMSPQAKKSSSEYYELKLQIRLLYYKDNLNIIKKIIPLLDPLSRNVNKIEELDNGLDIYLNNYNLMNKIVSIFKDKYFIFEKRTKKILGRNFLESRDVWRYTQCIDIINVKRGTKLNFKGIDYQVKAINKNDLVLINLENGAKKVLSYKIVKEYLMIYTEEEAKNIKDMIQ